MLTSRFPLKRTIAALLPVCFLWVFIACVSLCASDAEEVEHDGGGAILSLGIESTPDSECCPIIESPKAALSERVSVQSASTVSALPLILAPSSGSALAPSHKSNHHLFADPPFERLLTLRI
jgi:hypothetical protein